MRRLTKDAGIYILVNIVLLIVAIILISIFCLNYNSNRNSIIETVSDQTNIIVESIQAEKETEEKTNTTGNAEIILPTINDGETSTSTTSETYNNKFYYSQLNYNQKLIYNDMEKNAAKMKKGTYKFSLSTTVARTLDNPNGMETLNLDFQSALDALVMDRVDLFYLDVSKMSLEVRSVTYGDNTKNYLSIIPSSDSGNYLEAGLSNEQDVDSVLIQISTARNDIINSLEGSQYNKIKQAHNWLVDNLDYSTECGTNAYNIYGALVQKKSVCEGYAEAFKYIMDKIGITCVLVSGTASNSEGKTENHEWNYVQLDGNWYAVDATWDDPILVGNGRLTSSDKYRYFLKGSNTMNKNHFENGRFSSTGMKFTYPTLSEENY